MKICFCSDGFHLISLIEFFLLRYLHFGLRGHILNTTFFSLFSFFPAIQKREEEREKKEEEREKREEEREKREEERRREERQSRERARQQASQE